MASRTQHCTHCEEVGHLQAFCSKLWSSRIHRSCRRGLELFVHDEGDRVADSFGGSGWGGHFEKRYFGRTDPLISSRCLAVFQNRHSNVDVVVR